MKIYTKYILVSLLIFVVFLGFFFFSKPQIQKLFNKENTTIPITEISVVSTGANIDNKNNSFPLLSTRDINMLSSEEKGKLLSYIQSLNSIERKKLFLSEKFYFYDENRFYSNFHVLNEDIKKFKISGIYEAFMKCIYPYYIGKSVGELSEHLKSRHDLVDLFKKGDTEGLKQIQLTTKDEELKKFAIFLISVHSRICDPRSKDCVFNTSEKIRDLLMNVQIESGFENGSPQSSGSLDNQIDLYITCLYSRFYKKISDLKPFLNQLSPFMLLNEQTGNFEGIYDLFENDFLKHLENVLKN